MQQQVEVLQEEGEIGEFRVSDAADDDNKQISDIQAFVDAGDCDAIIISPSTTATLTPAVEAACESGVPVIVFDRGVNTDCMVTFIHPIGGYAYGADGRGVPGREPGARAPRCWRCASSPASTCSRTGGPPPRRSSATASSRCSATSSPAATAPRSRTS